MSVRCGYCGEEHPSAQWVKDCSMRFLRRNSKPDLHPVNAAALRVAEENMARIKQMREEPRDVERNLAGIARAREALRPGVGPAA